jgi:hypothetical protein
MLTQRVAQRQPAAPIQMTKSSFEYRKKVLNVKKAQLDQQLDDNSKLLLQAELANFNDQMDMINSEYWDDYNDDNQRYYLDQADANFQALPPLVIRAVASQKIRREFVSKTAELNRLFAKCDNAVRFSTLTPMQTSFATVDQVLYFTQFLPRITLARTSVNNDRQALALAEQTFNGIATLPTAVQIAAAKDVLRDMPSEHKYSRMIQLARNEAAALDAGSIKEKMAELIEDAVNDPNKQLDCDAQAIRSLADSYYARSFTRDNVVADLTARVNQQHNPNKDVWLRLLGLTKGSESVWIKDNVGTIDGFNVHASRFKDTMPNHASIATPLADLHDDLLGTGDGGYHVTMERFGPHGNGPHQRNPHAYRQGVSRQNNYVPKNGGGLNWATVRTELEHLRDVEVQAAEDAIDAFVNRKGRKNP